MPKKNVDNTRWAFLLIRPNSMSPPKGTAMAPRVPTTDYEGFRAYLLTVTTDILRFLAGSRASPGHRSAASTVFSEVCLYR